MLYTKARHCKTARGIAGRYVCGTIVAQQVHGAKRDLQTALFYDADGAKWIEPGFTEDPGEQAGCYVRRKSRYQQK